MMTTDYAATVGESGGESLAEDLVFRDCWIPAEGGVSLHAWEVRPVDVTTPLPTITMAHGFAGLKYRGLAEYARTFARAGFGVLVHDHRNFGLSGGAVRGDIDPWQQIADWRRVISYAEAQDWCDAGRIGIWGTSFAGGHVLVLGATDDRVKVVVSQVPTIDGYEQSLRRLDPAGRAALEAELSDDERQQLRGAPPFAQRVNSLDPKVRAAYRSQDIIDFHAHFEVPETVDRSEFITLRSTRRASMYQPGLWIDRLAPKPLLMVVGERDVTTPADIALSAFERAGEPKQLVTFDGEHYDAYVAAFGQTAGAALDWFIDHLRPEARP
jgi:pimeloyl-ACP methyl ester carboxylesterase